MYEVKTAGMRDAEILRLRKADACILGVDAKAKAVDEFIETITRTSILAGLSREDLAWFPDAGEFVETTVYNRSRLVVGDRFPGPAVIEEEGSTLVVGPSASFIVVPTGNIVVALAP